MKKSHPKSLASILSGQSSHLQRLVEATNQLKRLNQLFNAIVKPPLSEHCEIANIRNNQLVIFIDSPVWGTRLRYQQASLLEALHQESAFADIQGLEIKVRPRLSGIARQNPNHTEKV